MMYCVEFARLSTARPKCPTRAGSPIFVVVAMPRSYPCEHRPMTSPMRMFLDTRARRISGETKHRMTVEMQGSRYRPRSLNAGGKARFRGGDLGGEPTISEDNALGSACPNS